MTEDPTVPGNYRISPSLLAKKGTAEPLSKSGLSLILANEKNAQPSDDRQMTNAVIESTLDLLLDDPGKSAKAKAASPLTDLLDPTLINAVRRS